MFRNRINSCSTLFILVQIAQILFIVQAQSLGSVQECADDIPPDGFDCKKQKQWGKCNAYWMVEGNYCYETCGRCMTMEARVHRIVDTAITLGDEQTSEGISANASQKINEAIEQHMQLNFQNYEVTLFLNDVDFLLLMGAAGVLHQQNLELECPGGAGPQVRTTSSQLDEFVLSVQLEASNNLDTKFVIPVVTECPDASGISETRFEVLLVDATFPNFVNEVKVIYSEKVRHPNDGTI